MKKRFADLLFREYEEIARRAPTVLDIPSPHAVGAFFLFADLAANIRATRQDRSRYNAGHSSRCLVRQDTLGKEAPLRGSQHGVVSGPRASAAGLLKAGTPCLRIVDGGVCGEGTGERVRRAF